MSTGGTLSMASRTGSGGRFGRVGLGVGVWALALALAACSPAASTGSARGAGSTSASATATFAPDGPGQRLEGYYTLFLEGEKPAIRRYEIGGPWVANIYPNGRLTLQGPARPCCSLISKTSITGNQITVYAHGEYDRCTGRGVYTWKISGKGVRFTVVKDDCVVRELLLSQPWAYEGTPG
jgi:hypothetical protein